LTKKLEDEMKNIGGQAVIEGVMIRGRKAMVTAVRRPDGQIFVFFVIVVAAAEAAVVRAIKSSFWRQMIDSNCVQRTPVSGL
jgi:uncharacterized protein YqhQ